MLMMIRTAILTITVITLMLMMITGGVTMQCIILLIISLVRTIVKLYVMMSMALEDYSLKLKFRFS